jgi:hypothetical protein
MQGAAAGQETRTCRDLGHAELREHGLGVGAQLARLEDDVQRDAVGCRAKRGDQWRERIGLVHEQDIRVEDEERDLAVAGDSVGKIAEAAERHLELERLPELLECARRRARRATVEKAALERRDGLGLTAHQPRTGAAGAQPKRPRPAQHLGPGRQPDDRHDFLATQISSAGHFFAHSTVT